MKIQASTPELTATIAETLLSKPDKSNKSTKSAESAGTDTNPDTMKALYKKLESLAVQLSQSPTTQSVEEVRELSDKILSDIASVKRQISSVGDSVASLSPENYRHRVASMQPETRLDFCYQLQANPASLWDAVPFLNVLKKWKYGCKTDAIRTLLEETALAVGGILLAIGKLRFQ